MNNQQYIKALNEKHHRNNLKREKKLQKLNIETIQLEEKMDGKNDQSDIEQMEEYFSSDEEYGDTSIKVNEPIEKS